MEFDNVLKLEEYIQNRIMNYLYSGKLVAVPAYRTECVDVRFGDTVLSMPLLRAYLNLNIYNLLKGMGVSNSVILSHLFEVSATSKNTINYINRVMMLFDTDDDKSNVSYWIACYFYKMTQFLENRESRDISLFDIFEVTSKDERARKIIIEGNLVNEHMNPYQIMKVKEQVFDDLVDIVKKHKLEPFYTFLMSESCMRLPQFIDCFGLIGANPSDNTVTPFLVEESWFRGINNVPSFFVASTTARTAKIMEKCKISETGRALKDSMFINKDLSVVDGDCGTHHLLEIMINDELDLKAHDGMNYAMEKNSHRYKKISTEDKHLIGKTIFLRSPATCAYIDGNLCSTCVGIDVLRKFDLGLDCSMKIMGDAGQTMLSAKHIMVLIALEHIREDHLKYINNTILNTLELSDDVEQIRFMQYSVTDSMANTSLLRLYLKDGNMIDVEIYDTTVTTHITNLVDKRVAANGSESATVDNWDAVRITNMNKPKSKLFTTLMYLLNRSNNDSNYYAIINEVYNSCRDKYHGVQIYTLVNRHLRNPDNYYERFDFKSNRDPREGKFLSMLSLLGYLPVTESLPHGKQVMEKTLLAPETYMNYKNKSNTMDVIILPRRREDLIKLLKTHRHMLDLDE